jgi:proline iminopeptidase
MRNNCLLPLFVFVIVLLNGCAPNPDNTSANSSVYFEKTGDSIQTGGVQVIPVSTPKGTFNVWTKRFGNHPTKKLLLLNGGPGSTHEYFECFENFLPKEGIEFIYYDQLTCGNSDNPNDSSLFDLGRYVEEVEQVRQALHLDSSNFYLLGHSWGGILAMQYALKYQSHLKGLVISNMMASCPQYGKYANEVLAKQMRPAVLDSIKAIEAKGDFQNPAYMNLLKKNFYNEHIIRMAVWPEPMVRAFNRTNNDLYVTMQGPSEFGIAGKLANWDVSSELKNIHVPTLVIGATHDTMDPHYMEWMSKQIPGADFLLCPKGSHMSMYDDQQTYMDGLIKFMKKGK